MKKFKILLYRAGYKIAKIYWWLVRPRTQGVRAVVVSEGKILLARHSYDGFSDLYSLPGGSLRRGENKEEAIKRELKEELQLEIKEVNYLGEIKRFSEYKHDTVHCFKIKPKTKDIIIDQKEIVEAEWFLIDNLPINTSRFTKQDLNTFNL